MSSFHRHIKLCSKCNISLVSSPKLSVTRLFLVLNDSFAVVILDSVSRIHLASFVILSKQLKYSTFHHCFWSAIICVSHWMTTQTKPFKPAHLITLQTQNNIVLIIYTCLFTAADSVFKARVSLWAVFKVIILESDLYGLNTFATGVVQFHFATGVVQFRFRKFRYAC